jgi:SOS-response transcriptional repressor LexA
MMGLTRRQRACLEAVKAFHKRNGTMPSCEDLRKELGLSSRSAASRLLDRLEHRGAIKRIHGCARAIVVKRQRCPKCGYEMKGPR